jgi:hypothetical protein
LEFPDEEADQKARSASQEGREAWTEGRSAQDSPRLERRHAAVTPEKKATRRVAEVRKERL